MEAGNRVIVRPDAAGCTCRPGGREFGGLGSVADSAVRLGVGWPAVGPGREWPAQPRASPGKMQSESARLAGKPSGHREEASPQGLGGHQLLAHNLYRQPGTVGGEAAGWEMIEAHAVLEVSDGVLDLGVAAMVGLQLQRLSVPVGDETVIAVAGEEGQLGTGRGLHPPDDEPHRRGIGLAPEGSVSGLGHVGGTVHPVRDGRPVRLGYGFNEIAQAGALADGDGEADLRLATDGDNSVGVEAAVGPHRELPLSPGIAHPSHGLPQEVGGAPIGVGEALAQPGHQHVAGSSGHGQQRVIASLASVAMVSRPLLGQPVGLADGGVQVDDQRPVAGSGTGGPGPGQQLPAHPVQLADMAPPEAAQERPQGGGRLDHAPQYRGGSPRKQRIGVVNAVAARQRRGHQRQQLVSRVRPPRRIPEVEVTVNEFTQAHVLGQSGRKEQPSIVDQGVVVEGDLDAVGVLKW